jgi:flagellar motor switch protein FliG
MKELKFCYKPERKNEMTGMLIKKFLLISSFLLLLGIIFSSNVVIVKAQEDTISSSGDIPEITLLQLKDKYEKEIESKTQEIFNRILGPKKAKVTSVHLELNVEKYEEKASEEKAAREEEKKIMLDDVANYLLPGVPVPPGMRAPEKPAKLAAKGEEKGKKKIVIPSLIKKLEIAAIVDEKVPPQTLDKCRQVIITSLGMDLTPPPDGRGDKLIIERVPFAAETSLFIEKFLQPEVLTPAILGLLFLLFLSSFLPSAVKHISNAIRESRGAEISIQAKTEQTTSGQQQTQATTAAGVAGGEVQAGPKEEEKKKEKEEEEKYVPFSFINRDNLKNLIYLLIGEPPEIIALILSYLEPSLAGEVVVNLPIELQMRVALAMSTVRLTSKEDLMRLEEDIKKKIDFLVGGIESFIKILEQVDFKTRNEMLSVLEEQSPRLAQRVREMMFMFDDIAQLSNRDIQLVLRELTPTQIAVALHEPISPHIVEKIMSNLSEGGRALVKEEMEFGKPVTQAQVEEQRREIEKIVRRLAAENRITLGTEGSEKKSVIIEGKLEKIDLSKRETAEEKQPVYDPQKATEHFQNGLRAYQGGNIDLAIRELQKSIEYNPNSWQVYQLLGNCYYSRRLIKEAIASYEKALSLNPGNIQLKRWLDSQKARLRTLM